MTSSSLLSTALRRLSLRARLVCLTAGVLAIGLLWSNVIMMTSLRATLVDRVDRQLDGIANIAAVFTPDLFARTQPYPTASTRFSMDVVSEIYLAYLSATGEQIHVIRGSERGGERGEVATPRLPALDAGAVALRAGRPFGIRFSDGSAWRALAKPRTTLDGTSVVVAASLAGVDSIADQVRTRNLSIGLAILATMALLGFFAVRLGLRPLRRVEETAGAIAVGDFGRRVPDLATPNTEIGRLSAAFNGMLAQVEAAIDARKASETRLRRFVADASHELRTPLSGIKGLAELHRMGAFPERVDIDHTMKCIERESIRLSSLVDDLLLLAQLDEHGEPTSLRLRLAPMDLRSLAVEALHNVRALDPSREVTLTGPGGGPTGGAPTVGDEQRLWQVVSNLVGNAVAHTPTGTPVRIGVGTVAGCAVVEIADEGPGLTEEQAERVFERFYRTDSSRGRSAGGGAGLGLSIARSLVTAHGGRLELVTAVGNGSTFRVVLPGGESR